MQATQLSDLTTTLTVEDLPPAAFRTFMQDLQGNQSFHLHADTIKDVQGLVALVDAPTTRVPKTVMGNLQVRWTGATGDMTHEVPAVG